MEEFVIYSVGLCYSSVCSSLPQEEVKTKMNRTPTDISSHWSLANKPFRTGEPNPCPCDRRPKTHKHYLFVC